MAMRDACKRSVEAAIGRPITVAESRGIEERIRNAMTQLARKDPGSWRSLSEPEKMKEAGKFAAQELIEAAKKATQRVELATLAKQRAQSYIDEQVAAGHDATPVKALIRMLSGRNDWQNNGIPVEQLAKGIFRDAVREMEDAVEALRPGVWKFIPWGSKRVQAAFYDALHGVKGDHITPEIQRAADTYHKVIDRLVEEFNAAGGAVSKLENRGMGHSWSDRIANKLGRERWVAAFMRFIDRSKYVKEDGARFTDDEMRSWLEEAWLTVSTNGVSKEVTRLPGGTAMKANRHRHHREIHLKPEFAREALTQFSHRSGLEAIVGELRQLSRDIALIRTFGPNSDHMFAMLLDESVTRTARSVETDKSGVTRAVAAGGAVADRFWASALYDYLAGNVAPPANRPVADFMGVWRSLEVIRKLLGSPVSMLVTDPVYLHLMAHHLKLDHFKVAANQALALSPKSRRYLRRLGLLTETITGHADRFANDYVMGRELAGRVAGEALRAAGANFITETRRIGLSVTLMDSLGHLTRQKAYADITKLKADDHARLRQFGLDQETWDIWRKAKLDRHGANHTLLTPENIMAVDGYDERTLRQAVQKLMAFISQEEDIAVIQPGARERVHLGAGIQTGTLPGEVTRAIAQFKSFPWAVFTRPWEIALNAPGGMNRYSSVAALVIMTTVGGAMLNWLWDLYRGKDPRSIDPTSKEGVSNIVSGFLRGGGGGIWADFLFSETREANGAGFIETAAGPQAATVGETFRYTIGNAVETLQANARGEDIGEATNFGSETVRGLRSWFPNFHYTQALMDRYVWNQLAEAAEPGYMERMKRRQRSTYGTTYWWDPATAAPPWEAERAPDLESAVAKEPRH